MDSGRENFSLSGPLHITTIDWYGILQHSYSFPIFVLADVNDLSTILCIDVFCDCRLVVIGGERNQALSKQISALVDLKKVVNLYLDTWHL